MDDEKEISIATGMVVTKRVNDDKAIKVAKKSLEKINNCRIGELSLFDKIK